MSSSVVTESVVAFLKDIPPFQFLPLTELAALADSMTLEYFPKGTVILTAGHKASDSLYVVQKGGVKLGIRTAVGKELCLDMRSEGEIFGLLSLMGRDVARLDVIAIEDTLCYSIPAGQVQRLISRYTEVADFFFRTSVTRYLDRGLHELREQMRLMGDTERLLYSLTVRDTTTKPAVVCKESTTICEAARLAAAENATCLFVVDANGRVAGIVTDNDFAGKVVASGLPLDLPVTRVMSTPVIAVESSQGVFEALVAMLSHDISHVLVTEAGIPKGVLSDHDLMLLQGKSPLSLVRHLEQQQTLEDLAAAQKRIGDLLPLLMREGAKASHITRVVAGVNDRLMSKILDLAIARLGPAPVPFCWVTLGSEGRREQTFKTDQDNGLIYADVADGNSAAVEQYFAKLASFARGALARCGYPPCPGNYMASNPRWRQSLKGWQNYFSEWITTAELRSVQDALILFDMRPVAGDFSLFERLAAHRRDLLSNAGFFKSILAYVSTENKAPLGFFRTLVVERSGEHKQELDLKLLGTGPIVNAARLLALDAGIEDTNTVDRLSALQSLAHDDMPVTDLQEAFEYLMLLRLECQIRQARAGRPLSSYIRPETLTNLQKTMLKQAFQAIGRIQSLIDAKFRSSVWWQLGR